MTLQITPPNKFLANNNISLPSSPLTLALMNISLSQPPLEDNQWAYLLALAWNNSGTYQVQWALAYDYTNARVVVVNVKQDGTARSFSTTGTYTYADVKHLGLIVASNTQAYLLVNETDIYSLVPPDDFGLISGNYTLATLGLLGNLPSNLGYSLGEVAIWNQVLCPAYLAGAASYGPNAIRPAAQVHLWKFGVNSTPDYKDSLGEGREWVPFYAGYLPTVSANKIDYIKWTQWPGSPWVFDYPFIHSATRHTSTRRSLLLRRRRRNMLYVKPGETDTNKLRVFFQLYGTDGVTAVTTEDGGQPEISINGGAWQNSGISTLTHIGNGRYYAVISASTVQNLQPGDRIETRYKSANTAECPGDSVLISNFVPSYSDLANSVMSKLNDVATKLQDMIEYTGSYYRYKDQAAKDWLATERAQIRKALGVTGTMSDLDPAGVLTSIASALYWAELEAQIVSATEVRWIARWYKTETPIVASNVYISVKDISGNSVFGSMLASSGDGGYTHSLSTSNTISAGAPYIVTVQATVDGEVRSFSQIVRPR